MPPKKKSKTSTPATLPCFATARLTIIGANPVQRKIWQKCGGPTFLKPSQVTQLTNDRDYVVIASNVDASTVQARKGRRARRHGPLAHGLDRAQRAAGRG